MAFLPTLPPGNINSVRGLNPIQQPPYTYLPALAFLANLTPPTKRFFKIRI